MTKTFKKADKDNATVILDQGNYVKKLKELILADTSKFIRIKFTACICYFHQISIFSPNDSPSKNRENAFYFI